MAGEEGAVMGLRIEKQKEKNKNFEFQISNGSCREPILNSKFEIRNFQFRFFHGLPGLLPHREPYSFHRKKQQFRFGGQALHIFADMLHDLRRCRTGLECLGQIGHCGQRTRTRGET